MKALQVSIMGLCLTGFLACAQNSKTPKQVLDGFSEKFPTAKSVKWDKENEKEWEAEFKMNRMEYSANFTSDGTWKETEYEIEKSAIPSAVKKTLDSNFAGYDIDEAEVSETATGKVYEFALEKGETNMEVAISPNGKVVKKEVKDEEYSDND